MNMLGSDYILLFRAHHQIGAAKIKDNPVIYDVSDVESVNDLYLVSDLMITDYSSTMFDYANLMRPMVSYVRRRFLRTRCAWSLPVAGRITGTNHKNGTGTG